MKGYANWQTPRNLFAPKVRKNFSFDPPLPWQPKTAQAPHPNERRSKPDATT